MARLRYQIGSYETESMFDAKRQWRRMKNQIIHDRLFEAGLVGNPGDPFPEAEIAMKALHEENRRLRNRLSILSKWPASYPANANIVRMREFAAESLIDPNLVAESELQGRR